MSNVFMDGLIANSQQNKYFNWYKSIICRGQERGLKRGFVVRNFGYVEKHHIINKKFESDLLIEHPDNYVFLTAKEHILVHRLQCKFITHKQWLHSSLAAFGCMRRTNGGKNKRVVSLHLLAKMRESSSIAEKERYRPKAKVPKWFTSHDYSEFAHTFAQHVNDGLSDKTIGEIYGVSYTIIHKWRSNLGLGRRREGLRDRELLQKLYIADRLSQAEIGIMLNCTGAAVGSYLRKFDIPLRNRQDISKLADSKRPRKDNGQYDYASQQSM